MEKINQFSLQRFLLLMQRYLSFNHKTLLIGFGAISGIIIVVGIIMAYNSVGYFHIQPLVSFGQVLIFVAGLAITSNAYKEIHTPARSLFYLTLPATTSEKLFSNWFLTSLVYIIVANLVLMLVILIVNLIGMMFWSLPLNIFNPLSQENIRIMSVYMVIHSIFFLGSLAFRKNNMLKTILSLFVVSMAINLIMILFAWILFRQVGFHYQPDTINSGLQTIIAQTLPKVAEIMFYALIIPFCLLVSYFKLKEREV
jgi:hypothetical protein